MTVEEVEAAAERRVQIAVGSLTLLAMAAGAGGYCVAAVHVVGALAATLAVIVLVAVIHAQVSTLADAVGRAAALLDDEKRARAADAGGWLAGQQLEDRRS